MAPVSNEEMLQAVLHPFTEALDNEGLTLPLLAKKLKKELNAKETRAFNYQGEVSYSKPMVAWDIRQKARRDALAYRGVIVTQKVEHSGTVGLDLEGKLREAIEKAHGSGPADQ